MTKMPAILLVKTAAPAAPLGNDVRVYFNESGSLCSIDANGVIKIYGESLTQEQVQDFVGSMFTNTSTINCTYDDVGNIITFDVVVGSINHNALLNYSPNRHIDHAAVGVTAGPGLTGGGDLTESRTISMPDVGAANTYGSASSIPVVTTDAKGRVSGVTVVTVAIPSANITDFLEAVQDAVGGIFADTASIDFVYNDSGNAISANVIPSGVNHDALNNYSANRHIDHSAVSVSAGAGLTGGGDLTVSRTLSIPTSGVTASSYGSASQIPVFSVNAIGFITSASNTPVAIPSSQVTDFSEAVDDRVAALIQNGTGITWTYNDPANTFTANVSLTAFTTTSLAEGGNLYYTDARARAAVSATDTASIDFAYNPSTGVFSGVVLPTGVDHNALGNYSANRHIDHSSVNIAAGAGLTGGGDITISRTISMPSVGTAGSYGSATSVAAITTDAQGRVSAAASTPIAIPSTQVTDFAEAVQDTMGGALVDSATVDFVYNDVANTQTANVIPSAVDHDALLNYVSNKHIDHSAVSVSAGSGLTGGGDITSSRTISMPNVGVAGTYGDASTYPIITTDAQGRVSSVTTLPLPVGLLKAKTTMSVTNNSNVTNVNLTELGITLAANTTYEISVKLIFRTASATVGISVAYGGGTAVINSIVGHNATTVAPSGGAARYTFISATTNTTFTSTATVNQDQIMDALMIVTTGATGGTFVPQFRSETSGTTIEVRANSRIVAEAF
jgi:hypothetical protein